jgi:inosine-uridine nucleoside N-ribohydrolase
MKVIIDCDPGIDDSYALAFACLNEEVEILAITIVHGNTSVENGALNAKLLLDKIYPNKNQPQIYMGSVNPLSKNPNVFYFHHKDGLAGTHETLYKNEIENLKETFLKEKMTVDAPHAANKIIELVNKYPNEITIIALAPLTNLALALRMCHDPVEFTKKIKKLVIMGGNEPKYFSNEPNPNPIANYPEFNFKVDPAAAKIVIDEYQCPISLYTFECCLRSFCVKTEDLIEEFDKYIHKSKRCHFIERIGIIHRKSLASPNIFFCCDLSAMIGLLYGNECNAVYKNLTNCTIEIESTSSGQLDGLLIEGGTMGRSIELCVKMDPNVAYEIFKMYLKKMEKLDEDI